MNKKGKSKFPKEENEIVNDPIFCNIFSYKVRVIFLRISLYLLLLRKEMIQATFVSSRDNDLVTRSPWNVEF